MLDINNWKWNANVDMGKRYSFVLYEELTYIIFLYSIMYFYGFTNDLSCKCNFNLFCKLWSKWSARFYFQSMLEKSLYFF